VSTTTLVSTARPDPAPTRRRLDPVLLVPALATLVIGGWDLTTPSYWRDEAATLDAESRSVPALLHMLSNVDAVHGAYYLLMWPVVHVFGTSELALRLPSLLAMTAAATGVAALGRRLHSARAGLLAGLVFAVLPQVSRYGQEARSYAFVLACAVLASYLLIRAADEPLRERAADEPLPARAADQPLLVRAADDPRDRWFSDSGPAVGDPGRRWFSGSGPAGGEPLRRRFIGDGAGVGEPGCRWFAGSGPAVGESLRRRFVGDGAGVDEPGRSGFAGTSLGTGFNTGPGPGPGPGAVDPARCRRRWRWRWLVGYGCVIAALGLLNLFGLLLLAGHAVFLAARHRALLRRWFVVAAIGCLPALPIVVLAWQQRDQLGWLTEPDATAPADLTLWLAGSTGSVVLVSVLIGLGLRVRGSAATAWLALPWLLAPPVLLLSAAELAIPVYVQRYVTYCLPALALPVGVGLATITVAPRVIALLLIAGLGLPTQLAQREVGGHGDTIRVAADILAAHERPGDGVIYDCPTCHYRDMPREFAFAYPTAFGRLDDIALAASPSASGTLRGTEADRLNLDGVSRVWLVETGGNSVPTPLTAIGMHHVVTYIAGDIIVALYQY
jgi:hypothetical protein